MIEKLEKYTRTAVAFEQRYMAVKILGECFQRKPAWKKWVKEWWLLETDSDKDISGYVIIVYNKSTTRFLANNP